MAGYDNTNRGVLFKNDRKEKDTHADYQGTLNVDGQEFYLNAWLRDGKNGKFFSLSIKPKGERGAAPGKRVELDDEIPFRARLYSYGIRRSGSIGE